MTIVSKLADDPEASVRAELMEHVPHIAMLCHEDKQRLHPLILEHLLPLVVKFLGDNDNQVRKTSQAALLVLMEQGLVEQSAVEQQVCPVILMLTEMDSLVEFHTGAVALMSKMAPLIGRSSTERLFLSRFATLCTDPVFYVRKACAANFGEFCAVVGTESTESVLLPRFVDLCEDQIWGVRKACAEVFMSVSCACTLQTRKQNLAPVFANLLIDQSRWVRMSAFQTLGPFISTFADPSITGLSYNQAGELVILSQEGFEFRLNTSQVSDHEYSKFLAKVESSSPILISGRLMSFHHNSEISDQGDDVQTNNNFVQTNSFSFCDTDSTISCNLEENSSKNVVQDITIEETNEVSNTSDERIVSVNEDVIENEANIGEGSSIKSENIENASDIATEEECQNENNSSSETEQIENVQQLSESKLETYDGEDNRQLRVSESQGKVHIHVESSTLSGVDNFNTFQYWRVPIPELQLDISLADSGKPKTVHVKAKVTDETTQRTYASELNVDMDIDTELEKLSSRLEEGCSLTEMHARNHAQICTASIAMVTDTDKHGVENTTTVSSSVQNAVMWFDSVEMKPSVKYQRAAEYKQFNSPPSWSEMVGEGTEDQWLVQQPAVCGAPVTDKWDKQQSDSSATVSVSSQIIQDIVPQQLIDHFVSMTHPSQAQKTDNEIAHHCAFSLPAVALTLGRDNWTLLKDAYDTLASDMQWKVRRTVASSIHELAVILGEDLATKDLIPIFNGFIKDLDEVRIGALKHLAEFLKLLRPPGRNSYLPRLSEFLLTDNEWNWRFREELAEQLLAAVNLFTPEDTKKHLTPIAISLLLDKVAAVRQVALSLVTELVKHVSVDSGLLRDLLAELAEWFAHSKRWNRRQTFALLCSHLIVKQILPEELFARDILPHLLDLSWDPVPNVRLSVARTLATNIMAQQYFSSEENPHHEVLMQVLKRLQTDADRDVRYFASLCPSSITDVDEVSSTEIS